MSLTYEQLAAIRNPDARAAELRLHLAQLDTDVLVACFDDPSFGVRAAAAKGLRLRLDDALVARLIHEASTTQRRVAVCLAIAEPRVDAFEQLLAWTRDPAADVRYEALVGANRAAHELAGSYLELLHGAALERLENESDAGVLVVAAQICGEWQWADAFEQLSQRYDHLPRGFLRPNRDRFQLACVLAELAAVHPFADGLRETVRRDLEAQLMRDECSTPASRALAQLGDRLAVPSLERVAKSFRVHPIHRVEAAVALVVLGATTGAEHLKGVLEGRRKDARGWAMIQVARLGMRELRPSIEAIAQTDDYHADTALLALRLYGDEDARALVARVASTHADEEIREQARDVLHHWEQKDVV